MENRQFKLSRERYLMYLTRRESDLLDLQKSLNEGSSDAFKTIGHKIMGSAKTFGFDELEDLGVRLEKISVEELKAQGAALLTELSEWIKATRIKFPEIKST